MADVNPSECDQLRMEIGRLKNVVDSNRNIMNRLDDERKSSDKKISDLTKRLALSDAEKERAIMTRNQTHELLVESKTKISEQEDEIQKLKVSRGTTVRCCLDIIINSV